MNKSLLAVVGLIALTIGCKPDDESPAPVGGKGGNATLHVTPRHHGRQIDSCTIYIKYNAVDTPANGVYDDSARCVPVGGASVATFSGLRKGNYYVFGFGWDPTLTPPQHVRGGYAYPVSVETDQTLELAVSED